MCVDAKSQRVWHEPRADSRKLADNYGKKKRGLSIITLGFQNKAYRGQLGYNAGVGNTKGKVDKIRSHCQRETRG